MLATKDWRNATLLVPNKNYGATMEEIRKNPPPGVSGSGTTASTTTTTGGTTSTTAGTVTTTASVTTTTAPSSAPVTSTAYGAMIAKHSGKCLDVSGWSNANGGAIVQWNCNGQNNQKWSLRDVGNSQYQVVSRSSGKCLDNRGSKDGGTDVVQNSCAKTPQQLWTRRASASGHVQLASVGSGKCLNVRHYSSAAGAVIEQNTCTNSDSQKWALPS